MAIHLQSACAQVLLPFLTVGLLTQKRPDANASSRVISVSQ